MALPINFTLFKVNQNNNFKNRGNESVINVKDTVINMFIMLVTKETHRTLDKYKMSYPKILTA